MATVYSAIIESGDASDYWDGDIAWAYDATSDVYAPTAHVNEAARDAQYGTRIYSSVNAWEAARDGAAGAGDDEYGIIQGPWSNDDTNTFDISGWTTGTITVRAIGAARHSGVWEDGAGAAHRVVASDNSYITIFLESDVTVDGMQIHNTTIGDSATANIRPSDTGGVITNCVLNTADTGGNGILANTAACTVTIWNCVVYVPHTQGAASEGIYADNCTTMDVYNCTVYNFNDGIERDAGTVTVKNTAVFNCGDDIDGTISLENCATDDGTSSGSNGNITITQSADDWAALVVDAAGGDFNVTDASSELYNAGQDVSGSGITVDIMGTARPQATTYDIGAFEFIVEVGGISIPVAMHHYRQQRDHGS